MLEIMKKPNVYDIIAVLQKCYVAGENEIRQPLKRQLAPLFKWEDNGAVS